MDSFDILLLGPPTWAHVEGALAIPSQKGQALLWYLAAHPERASTRAHLADLLWSQEAEGDLRNNLSATLVRLKRVLPVWPVRVIQDSLLWDSRLPLSVDLHRFWEISERKPSSYHDILEERRHLEEALSLWRGPFLQEFEVPGSELYSEWLDRERRLLDERLLSLLARLVALLDAQGDWTSVMDRSRQALRHDPLQESFHRSLMLAHHRMGDRAGAVSQYQDLVRLLSDDLGVDPDPMTTRLLEAILSDRGKDAKAQPVAEVLTPLAPAVAFGRDETLTRIEASLALAGSEKGACGLLLVGEAGIGKTQVAQEMVSRVAAGRFGPALWTGLVGHCHEDFRDLPYAPFVEILRSAVQEIRPRMGTLSEPHRTQLVRLVPDLLPGKPTEDVGTPAGEARRHLFEAVVRALELIPGRLMLVLEDLHAADEGTLKLLAYLLRQGKDVPVAIVATSRLHAGPPDTERRLRALRDEGFLRWEKLGPLDLHGVEKVVANHLGHSDDRLSQALFHRSQGHPLFAVELLRHILRDGASNPSPDLPETVKDLIRSRIDILPKPALQLLQAASVFPLSPSLSTLQTVAGLQGESAVAGLEVLASAGLLKEEVPLGPHGGEPAFSFTHGLIREVVRSDLSQVRREALHKSAYSHLSGQLSFQTAPLSLAALEELAHHAGASRLYDEATQWAQEAGSAALRIHAFETTERLLEEALRYLSYLPISPENRARAVEIRMQLAWAAFFTEPAKISEQVAPAVMDTTKESASSDTTSSQTLAVIERMAALAERSGLHDVLASSVALKGSLLARRGDFTGALAAFREALSQDGLLLSASLPFECRIRMAHAEAILGRFDAARRSADELAGATANEPWRLAALDTLKAQAAHIRGEWEAALREGRQAALHAQMAGDPVREYLALSLTGLPLIRLGDPEGALEAQSTAISRAKRLGTPPGLGLAHAFLSEIYLDMNDLVSARSAALTGLELALAEESVHDVSICKRLLAQIQGRMGRTDEAMAIAQDALRSLNESQAVPEAARCRMAVASLATDHEMSRALRAEAASDFRRLGMEWDLRQMA